MKVNQIFQVFSKKIKKYNFKNVTQLLNVISNKTQIY